MLLVLCRPARHSALEELIFGWPVHTNALATTWEPLQNLPDALNRSMVNEYNRKLREEAGEMKSDAASSSCTAAAAPGSSATRTTPFTLSAKAAGKQKAKP